MTNELELFGKKLKIIRRKRHLTLEKLAELVDISPNHISKLEAARSNPSFQILVRLAKALDVELKELLDFDDFKQAKDIKNEIINAIKKSDNNDLHLMYKIYKQVK